MIQYCLIDIIYTHISEKKYNQTISIPHAKPTFKALTSNLGASSSKSWRQRSWNPKSACRKKTSRRPLDVGTQYDSRVSSWEFTFLFFRSNVMDWDSANCLKQDFAFFKSFTVFSLHSFTITITLLHPEAVCFKKIKNIHHPKRQVPINLPIFLFQIISCPSLLPFGYQPRYSLQRQNVPGKVLTWHCTNEHQEADDFLRIPTNSCATRRDAWKAAKG